MRSPAKSGFTLLELIVVIAIVTLLAGVLIPLVKNSLDEAKVSKVLALKDRVKRAAMKYWMDMDSLPTEGSTRHLLFQDPTGGSGKWKGPYLDLPVTGADVPWDGGSVSLDDTISGEDENENNGYLIAGVSVGPAAPNSGCQLILDKVPLSLAEKIEAALDPSELVRPGTTGVCESAPILGVPGETAKLYIFLFQKQ